MKNTSSPLTKPLGRLVIEDDDVNVIIEDFVSAVLLVLSSTVLSDTNPKCGRGVDIEGSVTKITATTTITTTTIAIIAVSSVFFLDFFGGGA